MPRIKEESERRKITRLCHFTQSRKLSHILTEFKGILSTERLKRKGPDILDVTDKARLNGHLDHICCSIEFPNTWYLRRIRGKDPHFKDWVVIFLEPHLLWATGTRFCPVNAATELGRRVSSGYSTFAGMFAEKVSSPRRTLARTSQMLPCCPTDDQAEVLVPDYIPIESFIGIAVKDPEQAEREQSRLSFFHNCSDVKWFVSPEIFTPEWSNQVRRGKRPEEYEYCPETKT